MGTRTGFGDDRAVRTPAKRKSMVRDLTETVLICAVVVLFLRAFVFQQSEIPSGSMETTILIGDHVLVNRFLYAPASFPWERRLLPIREPRRGDVVVFKHPPAPEQDYIKRVVGLPGETIALRDGTLWIDGRPRHEPYLHESASRGQDFGPRLVDDGHYFLLGDNRDRSSDSRVWGPVPVELIKGRAFLILFSTNATQPRGEPPGRVSPRSLARKLFNLVFHSRWERCLSFVR